MSKVDLVVSRRGARQEVVNVKITEHGWLGQKYEFDLFLDPDFSPIVLAEPGKVTFTGHGDIRAVYLVFSAPDLGLRKELGSRDFGEIQAKLDTTLFSWRKRVETAVAKDEKEQKKQIAKERTDEARRERAEIANFLSNHLRDFRFKTPEALEPKPNAAPKPFSEPEPKRESYPTRPILNEPSWTEPKISFAQKISGQSQSIIDDAKKRYGELLQRAKESHQSALTKYDFDVEMIERAHKKALAEYNAQKSQYEKEIARRVEHNQNSKDEWRETVALWRRNDRNAVVNVVAALLSSLSENKFFSGDFRIEYQGAERLLVLDYTLPSPPDMPDLKTCRYVISEDEFRETKISKTELHKLYENACYQLTLAVVYSIFELDGAQNIDAVAFNGVVSYKDTATGKNTSAVIMSAVFDQDTYSDVDLEHVEPKTCFQRFKGVSASNLVGLAPVAPIVQMNKEDKRFIDSRNETSSAAQGQNIAAMHWEDFEHLIREVFEKEFASRGAEVRVTQASSDGGVDAVVFDPDPILGGKIVIQAKRYTRPVDLSAVRDLFGTVLNEGASKGILVTTSDFGPDAYKFAADKPITLLNGSNLLHMLERQGVKANINIAEARQTLGLR